jgi:Sec-independent protein translocase protein TatA
MNSPNVGWCDLIVLALIVLAFFGARVLDKLAQELRNAMNDDHRSSRLRDDRQDQGAEPADQDLWNILALFVLLAALLVFWARTL